MFIGVNSFDNVDKFNIQMDLLILKSLLKIIKGFLIVFN